MRLYWRGGIVMSIQNEHLIAWAGAQVDAGMLPASVYGAVVAARNAAAETGPVAPGSLLAYRELIAKAVVLEREAAAFRAEAAELGDVDLIPVLPDRVLADPAAAAAWECRAAAAVTIERRRIEAEVCEISALALGLDAQAAALRAEAARLDVDVDFGGARRAAEQAVPFLAGAAFEAARRKARAAAERRAQVGLGQNARQRRLARREAARAAAAQSRTDLIVNDEFTTEPMREAALAALPPVKGGRFERRAVAALRRAALAD